MKIYELSKTKLKGLLQRKGEMQYFSWSFASSKEKGKQPDNKEVEDIFDPGGGGQRFRDGKDKKDPFVVVALWIICCNAKSSHIEIGRRLVHEYRKNLFPNFRTPP